MRLIMWNLITIDGFFEGAKKWDLGWHGPMIDDEFNRFATDQLRTAERLIFGRATNEGMAAHWPTATGEVARLMNAIPKTVFSRSGKVAEWNNVTAVRSDAVEAIRALKQSGTGNAFVFGSANLSAALVEDDLFDEYRIFIVPAILGAGTPLFGNGVGRHQFTLIDAKPFASGGVLHRYQPNRGRPTA